ncbi:MAG: hypothetical protein D6772_13940 [Bacteroidetes bacterium]|nr:MAG: hypothetical protein D6772_13940 [Bacteroidota bacterium]
MSKPSFFSILLLIFCAFVKSDPRPDWPQAVWAILPSPQMLQEGVVNKYYFHYLSNNAYEKSTDIRYYAYELTTADDLRLTIYNAGLEKMSELDMQITATGIMCRRIVQYLSGKAQETALLANTFLSWEPDTSNLIVITEFGEMGSEYLQIQQTSGLVDTTFLHRPATRVTYQRQRDYTYAQGEDQHFESTYTDYFVAGIGLAERRYTFAEGRGQMELVKQMSRADFATLRESVPKRVGYIDPEQTLDAYGYFQPCNDPNSIYDYYNGEQKAAFKSGKRGLEKALRSRIDPSFIAGESGYLTFRFVINCEGQTGWFVTEMADLNFQSKSFSPATVQHVYKILKGLKNWQAGRVRGETVDAYAYVTFKIIQGEIVDIFP